MNNRILRFLPYYLGKRMIRREKGNLEDKLGVLKMGFKRE